MPQELGYVELTPGGVTKTVEVVLASFDGSLRISHQPDAPIRVLIDLTDESLRLTSGEVEIAHWGLDEVQVSAQPDGFHVRRAGEELVLVMKDDAEFAVLLDLRSVPIGLARRMAVHRNGRR